MAEPRKLRSAMPLQHQVNTMAIRWCRGLAYFTGFKPLQMRQFQSKGWNYISVDGDSGLLVEQDKSGLAHNPVADKSLDLWKTLRNWLEGLRNGQIPAGTKFVLYVAQSHTGSVVERLHNSPISC